MSYRNINGWSTKADILEDLAEVTGGYTDLEEEFIAVGERPPPIRRWNDNDDEFNLRFSGVRDQYDMQVQSKGPDLKGITQMLRMVEEEDDRTIENEVIRRPKSKKKCVISISKLDPNVPEFVPKGATESSHRVKENLNISSKLDDEERNKEKNDDKAFNNETVILDKKLDKSKLNVEEIKDISLKLRNKISNVSKKEDLRMKKEKNVAIAALLKLHTAPAKDSEEQVPIKLFTPDYFARVPVPGREVSFEIHDVLVNVEPKSNKSNRVDDDSDRSQKYQTSSSRVNGNSGSIGRLGDTSSQSGKTSPKSYVETPNESNNFPSNPDIQKSIKKVTNWLRKPESPKPKGPVVCLGPISFKKKNVVKSPVGDEASSSRSSSSLNVTAPQIGHFVPSKRAEDLSKKYSERGKALERQSEDIWTKAMNEMKAIDSKKELQKSSSLNDSRDEDSLGSTNYISSE